jgi:hypothetical protein
MKKKLFVLSISFFACRQEILLAERPSLLRLADLDQDQRDDLVVISRRDDRPLSVEILLSSKEFTSPQQFLFAQEGDATELGDIDGDGDLDLLLLFRDQFQILQQQDDLTFSTLPPENREFIDSSQPSLRDANQDGSLDLVLFGSGNTTFFANDGAGVFSQASQDISAQNCFRLRATCADLDADGDLDEVSLPTLNAASIKLNLGDNTTFTEQLLTVSTPGQDEVFSTFDLGDIDGDGDVDIIASSDRTLTKEDGDQDFSEAIYLSRNNGDGSFAPLREIRADKFVRAKLRDITGDGVLDVLTFNTQRRALAFSFDGQEGAPSEHPFDIGINNDFEVGSLTTPDSIDLILLKRKKLEIRAVE